MSTAAVLQLPLFDDPSDPACWRVRYSARARRVSIRVFRDGAVEVIAPPSARPALIAEFVSRHRDWIAKQQLRATPLDFKFPPQSIALRASGETWVCDPALRRGALRERLAARAHELFAPQLRALAALMGVSFRRVQIRHQRTRWGSCSSRGTISLNGCLLFQRPEVVRYLLVHELTHLTHMNHGTRFWSAVARFEPDWRALDRELSNGWRQVPGWLLTRSA